MNFNEINNALDNLYTSSIALEDWAAQAGNQESHLAGILCSIAAEMKKQRNAIIEHIYLYGDA